MYANLVTGECVWEAPSGAKIKRTDENQWWELFDASTKRNYYYNAKTQRTVWQRPPSADIIPLAKLQMIKENTQPKDEQTIIIPPTSTVNHTVQQLIKTNNISPTVNNKRKQISLQGLNIIPNELQFKLSTPTSHSTTQRSIRRTGNNFYPHDILSSSITNDLTSSMNLNKTKNDKSTYDNLTNSIHYPLNRKSNKHYDNYSIISNQQQNSLDESLHLTKRSQSIHLKPSFPLQIAKQETNYQQSPHIFSRHISTPSLELFHNNQLNSLKLTRASFGRNNIRKKQPRTNPNYVNIEVKTDEGSLRSKYIRLDDIPKCSTLTYSSSSSNSSSEQESILCNSQTYLNESNMYFPSDETISLDKPNSKEKNKSIKNKKSSSNYDENKIDNNNHHKLTNTTDPVMKQFVTCNDEFLFHSTTDPLSANFQQIKIINNSDKKVNNNSSIQCRTNSDTSTVSSSILPIYYDTYSNSSSMTSQSMNRSHDISRIHTSSPNLTRSVSNHFNGLCHNKKNLHTSVQKQWISSSLSSTKSPLTINEIESDILFNEMLNLNIHKRSFFSKRLTQDNLLSWSKETITKPLLRTIDKILKKEAPEIFKLIQIYMGDRKSKQIGSLNTCLDLTTKGWSLPSIRDELYLQLIKQTTYNYNAESLQRGWELMAICLSFFPPSGKFQVLIERYISLQANGNVDTPEVPISIYAKVCQKRLEKILQTGPKKGLKKPTFEEIELSKHTIHFPSMFGTTLEEVMAMQRTRYPERRLPWIQTILSEEVLRLNGAQIEGIFRVPGDLDSVNALKVKCDQWQFPSVEDAHLPASLLKFWYRELAEPLIPSIFYEQCILNCDKVEPCIRLVNSLPEINRIVLTYLIRFLQIFARPENVTITKMDVNNLSMVFAPNILRCDSDDAKVIFENARKEMLFIKILILNLDTDSIEGVI
ncbi:unnamed protein product [Adineta steineri]|nr:unnamed protein product [Adineta steineri]